MSERSVSLELAEAERRFLTAALRQWGGAARATGQLAVALGFADLHHFHAETVRLRGLVENQAALTTDEWRRVLVASEVVFASDVFGAGLDWSIAAGITDDEALTLLRSIQRKMPRWRSSVQFDVTADGGVQVRDADRARTRHDA